MERLDIAANRRLRGLGPAPDRRADRRVRPRGAAESATVEPPSRDRPAAPHGRLRSDGGRQGHRGRPAAPPSIPRCSSRSRRPPGRRGPVRSTACTTCSSPRPSSTADRRGRAAGVGGRARPAPLRHPAGPGAGRARRGPATPCWRSTCRAPGRSGADWPERPVGVPGPAVLGGAGPPTGRPGHRVARPAGPAAGHRAGPSWPPRREFDHVVVNGEVGQAVADLVALLGL